MPRPGKESDVRVILSCAGTGGHIYPAIAIADRIREAEPDSEIIFIGTKNGMENEIVSKAGYTIYGINASAFYRRDILKNVKTLFDILRGSAQASGIIADFRPDAVIGTGGYVTGPVLRAAAKKGIDCYIHEQNAVVGLANLLLEQYTKKVFISFEKSRVMLRRPSAAILSGNPVRKEFFTSDPSECRKALGIEDGDFVVLAFGGSLGADVLNKAVLKLAELMPEEGFRLYFVSGKRYHDEISEKLSAAPPRKNLTLLPYADNMPQLMLASDLVISRAGAIALSEIAASGKPSVLIPSPNVTNNHQYFNAEAVKEAGAAVMLQESSFGPDFRELANAVLSLYGDRAFLASMAEASAALGIKDAANIIYENIKNKNG